MKIIKPTNQVIREKWELFNDFWLIVMFKNFIGYVALMTGSIYGVNSYLEDKVEIDYLSLVCSVLITYVALTFVYAKSNKK